MSRMVEQKIVGIIGGGQLGKMLAQDAASLGVRTVILEPDKNAPAAQVANEHIIAKYDNKNALKKIARKCDVVTYEFENVPSQVADVIRKQKKTRIYPPPIALKISQNRVNEKKFLSGLGIEVAPWVEPKTKKNLEQKIREFGEGILKTKTLGYDGKGQVVVRANNVSGVGSLAGLVLEKKIRFVCEFSIIAARSVNGKVVCYDPAQNTHKNGILAQSVVPAKINKTVQQKAEKITKKILNKLNYVGVIGIEFFLTDNNQVLVNEIAPRVHNSGHWTKEVCVTSQFEQHIRCVTGMPLGSAERFADCKMINLIGEDILNVDKWLKTKNAVVTVYGKKEIKPSRKMGHVTVVKK